jgi:hypothetical protein
VDSRSGLGCILLVTASLLHHAHLLELTLARAKLGLTGVGRLLMPIMTAATLPPFPDLSRVAFKKKDMSDHEGGGHCAELPDDLQGQWDLVLAQHVAAFDYLVEKAASEDGWALTRPILFAAHHVSEVALKAAWVAHDGRAPKRGHHLEPLWRRLREAGGLRHLEGSEINQASNFIALMEELTPDGQTTRYPMTGVKENDLGAIWCCLNCSALRAAVFAFLARLEPHE